MAAADKARFYLEKSVPNLQELSRKKIFNSEEISAIAKKRSDFEHVLNAPGSKPGDYVRYATYEMNLETLRKKRCTRLGVKSTAYSGQRTVFFILDRATKRFPGDTGLWLQYIGYCQREKAGKKLGKVFTSALRLKPREWRLWVLAAKHYAEGQGDMATARSYLQRGLRFCGDQERLYLEYAKLEMVYLAKLSARRQILGLDDKDKEKEERQPDDDQGDVVALPELTAEDINPESVEGLEEVDQGALRRLAEAPVFAGAIPMAIFDAAMKRFRDRVDIAESFFDLAARFENVPAISKVLEHVLNHLRSTAPQSAEAMACEAKAGLVSIDVDSAEFPAALGSCLVMVKKLISQAPDSEKLRLAEKSVVMLLPYLRQREELEEDIIKVLVASTTRYLRLLTESVQSGKEGRDHVKDLIARLHKDERHNDAETLDTLYNGMALG